MAKTVLTLEPDFDFSLIGISCHARDYRLCWSINRNLEMEFRRIEDYEVVAQRSKGTRVAFSQFIYDDEENMKSYTLFSNRSEGGFLLPEMKHADYLMVLKGNFPERDVEALKANLAGLDIVLATFEIDVLRLKSRQNLIF